MVSIGITPATGVVTLAPRWTIGSNLAGFHQMSQDLGLGGQANNFYSITNTGIPPGGDILAFNLYVAASGLATPHNDIGSKLTPDSYSALTSADPDIGYGAVNFYFIHHKSTGDYFSVIVPGSATSSAVTDLKPMDGPGGPATLGTSGYFGLTFAAANLGYGLNQFYYLRTDAVTGFTIFGKLDPALLNTSADQFSLGQSGYNALAFTGTDLGYGTDQMYYLRLDPITGYTILGTLNPDLGAGRHTADIANLGSVFTTLTFTPADLGFGVNQFYTTGAVNPTWQSVSFAAIADRALTDGSFTVNPTASSGLPIVLTVVTGSATISAPVGGVFTVTPTAGGYITLQATQVGAVNPTPYEYNMLRQGFTVSGGPAVVHPDFNLDGTTDLVWQNHSTGEVTITQMTGTTMGAHVSLTTQPAWKVVASGDFNSDGKSDLIWQNDYDGGVIVWMMNGTTPIAYEFLTTQPDWDVVGTGDFNADGRTDIVWQNQYSGGVIIWLMNGLTPIAYEFLTTQPYWKVAATGDFNADGKCDIVWQNWYDGGVALWLMNGTTFGSYVFLTTQPSWDVSSTGDFNGDGKADIVWQNWYDGGTAIWLMNGTAFGSFNFVSSQPTRRVMNRR